MHGRGAIAARLARTAAASLAAAALLAALLATGAAAQDAAPDNRVFSATVGAVVGRANDKLVSQPPDFVGALADLDQALSLGPTPYELGVILYMRGGAKYQLGDPAGAQADWTRALAEGALSETEHENLRYNLSQLEPPPQ